jgi:hypothetical protein
LGAEDFFGAGDAGQQSCFFSQQPQQTGTLCVAFCSGCLWQQAATMQHHPCGNARMEQHNQQQS